MKPLPAWAAKDVPAALQPVRLDAIRINGFWKPQARRLTQQWLPHCSRQMEQGWRGQEYLKLQALVRVRQGRQPNWEYTGESTATRSIVWLREAAKN